jgi:hypothetical protein
MSETTTTDVDTSVQDDAEFAAGFEGKTAEKIEKTTPPATDTPPPADTPQADADPAPEYVQISKKEWDEIKAAAARTASYDKQFSRAFGSIGNLHKLLEERKADATSPASTPAAARKVEVPKDAFAAMERDFPELAQQTRAALEAALSGLPVADVDATKIESMMASYHARREREALEDAYPDWRKIVGAVDITKEEPDPENPFRKWLATKDKSYQDRINGTESSAVMGRAIRLFQNETKAAAQPKPAATPPRTSDGRFVERTRAAVQPRGDGAGVPAGRSEQDEFEAGFANARA